MLRVCSNDKYVDFAPAGIKFCEYILVRAGLFAQAGNGIPSFVKASLISPIVKFTPLGILELIKVYKSLKKSRKEQQATSFQLVDKGLTFGSQPWVNFPSRSSLIGSLRNYCH